MEYKIEVNNRIVSAREGDSLLVALRENGIKIPTMCHMNRFTPTGACRLCAVEVEGKKDLITSCSYPVEDGMKVRTNSQRVIRARKTLVELLLSNHPDDCLYCQRNGNCELQWLAEEMNVRERKYFGAKPSLYPDYSSTSVARDPAKCVLCSRCVRMCEEVQLVNAIDFIARGNQTMVNSAFDKGLNVSSCIHCGQCIQVCPTAALLDISHVEKVQTALGDTGKRVVFFISPSVVASVAERTAMKPRQNVMYRISAALRRCGASQVFDLGAASDINILEDARILIERLQNKEQGALPLLSSCCPSWVRYVEEFRPSSVAHLSPVKSPQHIFGAMLKTMGTNHQNGSAQDGAIYAVAVMPCVAKKYEASLEDNTHKGVSEVDAVLTVREFFQLMRTFGLDLHQMEEEAPDAPFQTSSSAAWKPGYSGGKAEAVAHAVFRILAKGGKEEFRFPIPKNIAHRREAKVEIGGNKLGFAWVSSIAEAESYLLQLEEEKRDDIHYLEVMACKGGCAGGGGQPVSRGFDAVRERKRLCVEMEKKTGIDYPEANPALEQLLDNNRFAPPADATSAWLERRFKIWSNKDVTEK